MFVVSTYVYEYFLLYSYSVRWIVPFLIERYTGLRENPTSESSGAHSNAPNEKNLNGHNSNDALDFY